VIFAKEIAQMATGMVGFRFKMKKYKAAQTLTSFSVDGADRAILIASGDPLGDFTAFNLECRGQWR